jgi:hypothetical protein
MAGIKSVASYNDEETLPEAPQNRVGASGRVFLATSLSHQSEFVRSAEVVEFV